LRQTLQWLGFVVGVALALGTSLSVFRTLVVPRRVNSLIGNAVERGVRVVALWAALNLPYKVAGGNRQRNARAHFERADRVLAVTGPLSLLALLTVWQLSFILGYALMLWPVNNGTFSGALRESGSSFFTLGFTATDTPAATVVIFVSAATGLVSVALLIGYLPTLYGAFNRREKLVTTLEARAGVPAWGPEILVRQALVGLLDTLPALYADWEEWAADLSETHSNYPILIRFRSPSPYRSWIVGLIAVLDSAALYLAFCPQQAPTQARLVLRQGFSALRDIAVAIRVDVVEDPRPEDPVSLTYEEFLEGAQRMAAVGFPMERTPEEAWPHYRGWRVNYDAIAVEIADLIDAAPAPWSGRRTHFPEPIAPRRPLDRRPDDPEGTGDRPWTATSFQHASEAHERAEAEHNGQRAAERAARNGRRRGEAPAPPASAASAAGPAAPAPAPAPSAPRVAPGKVDET